MPQRLPGITAVFSISTASLPPQTGRRTAVGLPAVIQTCPQQIQLVGIPFCEIQTEYIAHAYIRTLTLSFTTTDLLTDTTPLAFIFCTAAGETFLVGSREPPYPVITQKLSTGRPGSDSAAVAVEVTFRSGQTPVPCQF